MKTHIAPNRNEYLPIFKSFLNPQSKKGNGISPISSQLNNLLIILSVALPSKPVQQLEPS